MTYDGDIEEPVFICKNCKPQGTIPFPLPKKTKFRKMHECKECKTVGKEGLLTYCTRCESAEFVCFSCIENWSNSAMPEKKDKQYFSFEDYEVTLEEKIKILMEQPYAIR